MNGCEMTGSVVNLSMDSPLPHNLRIYTPVQITPGL